MNALIDSESIQVPLARIHTDGGTQPRVTLDPAVIAEYADLMAGGVEFPPVIVFDDGHDAWLADGFHRLAAARQAGGVDILAEVRHGTRHDAVLYSVGANATHGVRRTNADKRRVVLTLLNDPEWIQWSNREIARRCAVTEITVRRIRAERSATMSQIDRPAWPIATVPPTACRPPRSARNSMPLWKRNRMQMNSSIRAIRSRAFSMRITILRHRRPFDPYERGHVQ